MPTYLSPGVYLEYLGGRFEWGTPVVAAEPPPLDAPLPVTRSRWREPTVTAAFVGFAAEGPVSEPTLLRGWSDFEEIFGGFLAGAHLAHTVYGYFQNGGRRCFVSRIPEAGEGNPREAITEEIHLLGKERVDVVCIPDLMSSYAAGALSSDEVAAVQLELVSACEASADRMALLDAPPGLDPRQVRDLRLAEGALESSLAALYYPQVRVRDPMTGGTATIPPCGHVAGLYAAIAEGRGLHCSPANESLNGVLDVERHLTLHEVDGLNPVGVNAIVAPSGSAVTVLGARTLSTMDPERRFVRQTRLQTYVFSSIVDGMRWVPHLPRGPALTAQVVGELEGFFDLLLRAGALAGGTAEEAYSVQWDPEPAANGSALLEVMCHLRASDETLLSFRVVFASV